MTREARPIPGHMKGRDWLMTQDWSIDEIELALDTADTLKDEFKSGVPTLHLAHKSAFLIFFDKSTRTRNSFEAGMTQLGGHAHFIDSETSQIAHGESPKDMGTILSTYGHGIMIRHDLVPGGPDLHARCCTTRVDPGHQHAVRRRPPLPDACRPDDDSRRVR